MKRYSAPFCSWLWPPLLLRRPASSCSSGPAPLILRMIDTRPKVMNSGRAIAWRARQAGSVVFTNGVFDLLHPGHVELLEAARREGSALIVGVNSDASVRRLGKGPDRPLKEQPVRARVVAGLAAVDTVVLFDEDTPLELIQQLAPDVLVKGADYARNAIV